MCDINGDGCATFKSLSVDSMRYNNLASIGYNDAMHLPTVREKYTGKTKISSFKVGITGCNLHVGDTIISDCDYGIHNGSIALEDNGTSSARFATYAFDGIEIYDCTTGIYSNVRFFITPVTQAVSRIHDCDIGFNVEGYLVADPSAKYNWEFYDCDLGMQITHFMRMNICLRLC